MPRRWGGAGREGPGAAQREGAEACGAPPRRRPPTRAHPSEEGRPAPGTVFGVLPGGRCPERGGRGLGRPCGCGPRPLRLSPPAAGLSPPAGQRSAAREGGDGGFPTRWQHSRAVGRPVLRRYPPAVLGTGLGSGRANSAFIFQHLSGFV